MAVLQRVGRITFILGLGSLLTPAVHAQSLRTYVAGLGDDAMPCTRSAPCRTFAGAYSKTATGGEINCLDAGGYGTITIARSMTIDCAGTLGSSHAARGTSITVDSAGTVVTLRNLSLNGTPPWAAGQNGIRFVRGAVLNVHNVHITGFGAPTPNGNGILIAPPGGLATIAISDSEIHNNGSGTGGSGIQVLPTGPSGVRLLLRNVRAASNAGNALRIDTTAVTGPGVIASIENSEFSGSAQGVAVVSGVAGAGESLVAINGSQIVNNATFGIVANGAGTTVRVDDTTILGNGTGVAAAGGARLQSYGSNRLDGNVTDGAFTGTIIPRR